MGCLRTDCTDRASDYEKKTRMAAAPILPACDSLAYFKRFQ